MHWDVVPVKYGMPENKKQKAGRSCRIFRIGVYLKIVWMISKTAQKIKLMCSLAFYLTGKSAARQIWNRQGGLPAFLVYVNGYLGIQYMM